jgi:hypothetical protein
VRAFGKGEFGFVAPLHALDDITLRFQIVGEQEGKIRIILDNKDARRRGGVRASERLARRAHTSPPAASMSILASVSGRLCGRSEGMDRPLTR